MRDREQVTGDFIDPRWPAHLHIDLLPAARGTGLGAALMARWLQQLQAAGSPGCHLLTLVENTRALKFFEKSGFRNHGNPALVGGMRGKKGNGCTSRSWCETRDRLVPARVAATLAEEAARLLG